jgi:hypothetical protein
MRFVAKTVEPAKDVGSALFGIGEGDGSSEAAAKLAGFTARRIAYIIADYWLMGISAALVLGMKALDYEFLPIFFALWTFDFLVAAAFVIVWQRTGIDLSLGEDFRRAADVIHAKSRITGMLAFALVAVQATVWSGPEQVVIFFRREIGSRARTALVLVALTGMQAAFWAGAYAFGYQSASELIEYVSDKWLGS